MGASLVETRAVAVGFRAGEAAVVAVFRVAASEDANDTLQICPFQSKTQASLCPGIKASSDTGGVIAQAGCTQLP